MSLARKFAFGALALVLATSGAANSQEGRQTWQQIVDKAKTQTLVMHIQSNRAADAIVGAFSKKFGVKVDMTVSRPSMSISRIRTEQQNGHYLADIWWSITGLMTTVAAPAGMFEPFENYLILPEVKDAANWRHPDYIYGDSFRTVFTYGHDVNRSVYRNRDVLPDVKIDSIDSLMDPKLKGRIAMRDASYPNAGSYSLAPIYKVKGADFLINFLKAQQPRVFENPEQLDNALIRGGSVLAIGGQGSSFSQCRADGGCKNIEVVEGIASTTSRGFAVLKNAPHPEAAKVFLNWVLSKEGQEILVREWAKGNLTGAVSMRKDVPPAPNHEQYLPDFNSPGQYVWVSTQRGDADIAAVVKIFKEWSGR